MNEEKQTETEETTRSGRKTVVGQVVSAKMDKTRRVDVARLSKHPIYGKYLRRRTVCYVHDENNLSKEGDVVEIMETRPISKSKRWRLVSVIREAGAVELGSEEGTPAEAPAETES